MNVNTVNECLLNQNDFDFLTNAKTVSTLSKKLVVAEMNVSFTVMFGSLMAVVLVMIVILAFMIRDRMKSGSNVLLSTAGLAAFALTFMGSYSVTNAQNLNVEIAEINKTLQAMTQPDIDVFTACNEPGAILKLSPNKDDPDFKSSYTQAISINQE